MKPRAAWMKRAGGRPGHPPGRESCGDRAISPAEMHRLAQAQLDPQVELRGLLRISHSEAPDGKGKSLPTGWSCFIAAARPPGPPAEYQLGLAPAF